MMGILKLFNKNKKYNKTIEAENVGSIAYDALMKFYINHLDLCSRQLEDADESDKKFILSGLIKNLDKNNHHLSLLIVTYGDIDDVTFMLDSPFEDVVQLARFRLTSLQCDALLTEVINM